MIWKLWTVATVALLAVAWALMVPLSPPPRSLSATAIDAYRARRVVPPAGAYEDSKAVGHAVFELPADDARHRAEERPAMAPMPGMTMGGTGDAETEAGEHGGGGAEAGISVRSVAGTAMPEAGAMSMARDGPGRTVEVTMREWGYEPANITARPGERLRLIVRNDGKLPHEFMVMTATGMGALDYRLERADWNLVEHEAVFERPVMLPGDAIELEVTVHEPGMWMFMCMFPFHMRLGLMGMIMSEEGSGRAPPARGGMKM